MYQQDIELAKLLVSKLAELNEQTGSLQDELQDAREDLEGLEQQRADRDKYSDILSRAASMLERTDLKVESPDLSQAESRVEELTGQLEDVNQEAEQFRTLVSELRERAPHLLDAVESGGELPAAEEGVAAAETEAETSEEEVTDDEEADQEEPAQAETEPALIEDDEAEAEEPVAAEEITEPEQETESAAPETAGTNEDVAAEEAVEVEAESSQDEPAETASSEEPAGSPGESNARFLIEQLKTKEAFTWGRGATYIIDATSVLSDVQHYNSELYQQDEHAMRDRLIRDLDNFSKEVTGTFYIVFDSWHQPVINFGNDIHLEYVTGDAQGKDWGVHRKFQELTTTFSSEERSVCIITSDTKLLSDLKADRLFKIELEGFFRM